MRQERQWSKELQLQLREVRGSRSGLDGGWVDSAVGLRCFGETVPESAVEAGAAHSVKNASILDFINFPGGLCVTVCSEHVEVRFDGHDGNNQDNNMLVVRREYASILESIREPISVERGSS